MTLQPYEIAVLLQMYEEKLIGHRGYTSLQTVRSKVKWQKIAAYYKVKESFDTLTRRLVKRRLLSDDGKSLAVLFLDKLGVDFVVGYIKENPDAMKDLADILK